MAKLVVDIETIGQNWDDIDVLTQQALTKRIQEAPGTPLYSAAVEEVKRQLVFSPLTGEIVTIGLLDVEKNQGVVYFQTPGEDRPDFTEDNITYKPLTEKQMLESFWGGAERYHEFITFNGRQFDIPYINARSLINKVRVRLDLMSNRYLNKQWGKAQHIDLYDQLGYYGAVRRSGGLHVWCQALGIPSPKADGVAGEDVGWMFKEKRFADIARYNARDLAATKQLYEYWQEYLRP